MLGSGAGLCPGQHDGEGKLRLVADSMHLVVHSVELRAHAFRLASCSLTEKCLWNTPRVPGTGPHPAEWLHCPRIEAFQ